MKALTKSVERPPSPRPSPPGRGRIIVSLSPLQPILETRKSHFAVPSPGGEGQGEGGPILQLDRDGLAFFDRYFAAWLNNIGQGLPKTGRAIAMRCVTVESGR